MTDDKSDWWQEWLSDRVTEWPSYQVTEWPSDQMTEWQEASQTIDRMVYLTLARTSKNPTEGGDKMKITETE